MTIKIARPVLVHYARRRWDKIREQHQIVYPEGVLVLNDTSAAILKLCNGRTVDEIASELSEMYNADMADIQDDVTEFIDTLSDRGLLRDANESS